MIPATDPANMIGTRYALFLPFQAHPKRP